MAPANVAVYLHLVAIGANPSPNLGTQPLSSSLCRKPAVHALDSLRGGGEGNGNVGVAHGAAYVLAMVADHGAYCSAGVSKIMSADLWQSGAVRRDQADAPRIGSELRRTQRLSMLSLLHGVDR